MSRGGRALVVVESPTKVKTIQKYLDSRFIVKASMGHVRDLPKSQLGVDPKTFTPRYVVSPSKKKIVDDLKRAAERSDALYVATDPDREGEAIGWHLVQELPVDRKKIYRITFNEITERAVRAAFERPGKIDLNKVDAQQARRVLDRLVGYTLSPLLWGKIQRGLSAGRVQSVAVRLIVDREREIEAFAPVEYWSLRARLAAGEPPEFEATLREIRGEKASLATGVETQAVVASLEGATFTVSAVTRGERRRNPAPPFITSTLQQDAGRKLGFSAKKTMTVAQQLYEGVELGVEGAVGLITYMRTDSVRVAQEAQTAAREWATRRYGADYVPDRPPVYASRGSAQEAHEAIRPSDVTREPRRIRRFLTKDQLALYQLIWERFLASQMVPAVYDTVSADITAGACVFRAQGQTLKFRGFTAVYVEGREEAEAPADDETDRAVPVLREGEILRLVALEPRQHFTQPPPRYTEASLIKKLEELGIGRPSTYASILGTIINDRGYVHRERRTLYPTELGMVVTDALKPYFPEIMDVDFTAQMEDRLDRVEEGGQKWRAAVEQFFGPFQKDLKRAEKEMDDWKVGEPTEEPCPECGSAFDPKAGTGGLLKRWGSSGMFLGCASYPECRYTKNLSPTGWRMPEEPTEETCPACGRDMVIKHGRFGKFVACTGYPECKTTKPYPLGIGCGRPGCDGQIVERRSKRGRTFYGCSTWPACDFVLWQRPVAQACPKCAAPFLTERTLRGGKLVRRCVREGCDHSQEAETPVA